MLRFHLDLDLDLAQGVGDGLLGIVAAVGDRASSGFRFGDEAVRAFTLPSGSAVLDVLAASFAMDSSRGRGRVMTGE
jgi:hypothetical protein